MYPRHYKQGLPIREQLLERAARTPESHFSIQALLEDLDHPSGSGDIQSNLRLIRQGWHSGINILRISALHALQSMSRRVEETCPEKLPQIREMLKSFDSDDVIINSLRWETLALYGGLEPLVSAESALSEMRGIIVSNAITEPSLVHTAAVCDESPAGFLARQAHGCLSRIFEDIFQGAYYEAYSELSDEEKCDILCLAAEAPQGFCTDWILRELSRYGGRRALPVYEHFASRLDTDAFCVQESVAAFAIGIEGYARFSEIPARYQGGNSPGHLAWETIGEILFWCCRAHAGDDNSQRIRDLWARLEGAAGLGAADALYQLAHSRWRLEERSGAGELITTFADQVRPILQCCLEHRHSLPSIFRYGGSQDPGVTHFLIDGLGKVGDGASISILQPLVDDPQCGKDAIEAIRSIRRRFVP